MAAAGRAVIPDGGSGNHHFRRFVQAIDRFHQLAGGHNAALHQFLLVSVRPPPVDGRPGQIDDSAASRQSLRQAIHAVLREQIAPQRRHLMPEHRKTAGQVAAYKSAGTRNGYIHDCKSDGGPSPRRALRNTAGNIPHGNGQPLPDKTFPPLSSVQRRTYFAAFLFLKRALHRNFPCGRTEKENLIFTGCLLCWKPSQPLLSHE